MNASSRAQTTASGTWVLDSAHSSASFEVKNMLFRTVTGRIGDLTGEIVLDEARISASSAHVTLNPATIDTGNAKRDVHLRGADFLDVERFPTITFQSTRVEGSGLDSFRITGDLTIGQVTRPITLEVSAAGTTTNERGQQARSFRATTSMLRHDFGITWGAPVMIGKVLNITLQIQAVRQS